MPGTPLSKTIDSFIDKGPVKIWVSWNMMGSLIGELTRVEEGVLCFQMPPDQALGGEKHTPIYILEADLRAIAKASTRDLAALNGGRPGLARV